MWHQNKTEKLNLSFWHPSQQPHSNANLKALLTWPGRLCYMDLKRKETLQLQNQCVLEPRSSDVQLQAVSMPANCSQKRVEAQPVNRMMPPGRERHSVASSRSIVPLLVPANVYILPLHVVLRTVRSHLVFHFLLSRVQGLFREVVFFFPDYKELQRNTRLVLHSQLGHASYHKGGIG